MPVPDGLPEEYQPKSMAETHSLDKEGYILGFITEMGGGVPKFTLVGQMFEDIHQILETTPHEIPVRFRDYHILHVCESTITPVYKWLKGKWVRVKNGDCP